MSRSAKASSGGERRHFSVRARGRGGGGVLGWREGENVIKGGKGTGRGRVVERWKVEGIIKGRREGEKKGRVV